MSVKPSRRAAVTGLNLAFLLTLAHGANDAFTNILPAFLPMLQERFGVGEAVLAAFVAIISLSSNVLQAFTGALVDRFGRRRAAALGLIVGSTLMSFLAVVPTIWSLVLLLAIGGLGSAVFHPAAVAMVHGSGARKGLGTGLFMSGGPLGTALMPVIVLAIVRNFGLQYVPWLALFGVLLGLMLFALAPQQTRPETRGKAKIFDKELFLGPVGLLSVAGMLRAAAFISFTNAIPLYLVNVRGFETDSAVIGWTLACYSGAAAVAVLISGALEQRVGRTRLVVGSMLIALPLALSVLFLTPGTLLFYVTAAFAGAFTNAAIPLLIVTAQELAPHAVATASGMLMGFTWGVAGVLYIGFGALQQLLGIGPALAVSFSFLIPGAFLALYVMRRNRAALSLG